MTDESFADAPLSIGEIRADKGGDAAAITPREMLISLLRAIDKGKKVTDMVVCYRYDEEDGERGGWSQSTKNSFVTLGLLKMTSDDISRAVRGRV